MDEGGLRPGLRDRHSARFRDPGAHRLRGALRLCERRRCFKPCVAVVRRGRRRGRSSCRSASSLRSNHSRSSTVGTRALKGFRTRSQFTTWWGSKTNSDRSSLPCLVINLQPPGAVLLARPPPRNPSASDVPPQAASRPIRKFTPSSAPQSSFMAGSRSIPRRQPAQALAGGDGDAEP